MRKDKLKENILRITANVNERKVWTFLDNLIVIEAQEIQAAHEVLNPSRNQDEAKSIETYFTSEKFRKREEKMMSIYEMATAQNKISVRNFNDFGNFCRHCLG